MSSVMTSEERDLIHQVLSAYDLPWTDFAPLPKWYGDHLRVRVMATGSLGFHLREKPGHLSLEDWTFHHHLQPAAPRLAFIPPLLHTRGGDAFVTVGERAFELIGWLPGESCAVTRTAQYEEVGRSLGRLHRYLASATLPPHARRTVATTNWMSMWLKLLANDGAHIPGMVNFIARVNELLAVPRIDPLQPIHGDVHQYNLIWDQGRISGICDWEDCHLNVPTFDLAYFLTHSAFIDWPSRVLLQPSEKTQREANPKVEIDWAGCRATLEAYRHELGHPIEASDLVRSLTESWVMTMRCTILTTAIDATITDAGRHIFESAVAPARIAEWQAILRG